ncbi:chemotaxis protein CheB [Paucibacter sp. APW11]|uniref:protein-glutamate O-methyltransferase n=1 Tax=Roseateles aquae TaxID=3077235 RepID=A0ABU3PEI1_9BURK|nr:chemotaxis protein CheB [Paucibacter sp. APW11]MDT9000979.1 chemotaxis protein CheB [Paucibacter sp. APW11]
MSKAHTAAPPERSAPKRPAAQGVASVVGIGCSAGGLAALEALLAAVPPGCGLCWVVVQHLSPEQPSALAELLQRVTPMPVQQAQDGSVVAADQVLVIPPGHSMRLSDGRLRLRSSAAPAGPPLPVDRFFVSLAEQLGADAVAIVLSGMGQDGLLGMRALHEVGALCLAQEPASAGADSMPRAIINAGLADVIALPAQMPARILAHLHDASAMASQDLPDSHAAETAPAPALALGTRSDLEDITALLFERTGQDFSLYKSNTLYRRIERRLAVHQLATLADYAKHLRDNPQELDLLFRELLIGVTSFFRDPAVWEQLAEQALPALLARQPAGKRLRAWVPACSSGEEAYTLAMLFREVQARQPAGRRFSLQIYATDLDADAIARARKGWYPDTIAADLTPERLAAHFVAEDGGWRISSEIRDMVVFAPQNLISDPPFIKLDILSCRNLLIYLGAQLQRRLLPLFHYALNPGGLLLLGSAETVGAFGDDFSVIDAKSRLYQRSERIASPGGLNFLIRPISEPNTPGDEWPALAADSLEVQTDRLIQQRFAPAAVLVTPDGDIVYISGRTGKYLEPAAGKVNINLHAMAREGLREALVGVLRKAAEQTEPIKLDAVQIDDEAGRLTLNVTVQGLHSPEVLRGRVLVVFHELPAPSARRRPRTLPDSHSALEQELLLTREALRAAHEETQRSLARLKASNEELQATNEELQSTNEELTTSKEELQSLNEELQTVNAELQSKVDDLSWVKNDMTNLLNSTEIATIFLDMEMQLRRFTSDVKRLFKLIPGDIGRPLSDIVSELDYPRLIADAVEVLRSLVYKETEARTADGRCYRVRIMPYRTLDNVIDGIVITFIEITEIKLMQAELKLLKS